MIDRNPGKGRERRQRKAKAVLVTWLVGKGHNTAAVTREMANEAVPGLRKLHSVTDDEYRRAGGKE